MAALARCTMWQGTALLCLILLASVGALERTWLMNQRVFGSYPTLAEGVMYLDVEGSVLVYGGMLSRNFLNDLFLWNPGAKVIRRIGTGPLPAGVSTMKGLANPSAYYIKWASAGSKVLMSFLPAAGGFFTDVNTTWPAMSVFLYDIAAQSEGWANVGAEGVGSGTFPGGIYGYGLAGTQGKFYLFGGRKHRQSYNDDLLMFDPSNFEWSLVPTQDAPKVPLLALSAHVPDLGNFRLHVTPREDEAAGIYDLASEGTHGATHSMAAMDDKIFFSNSSHIWQLDLPTMRWTEDERVVRSRVTRTGVLATCGGRLVHASCSDPEQVLDEVGAKRPGEVVTCDGKERSPEHDQGQEGNCSSPLVRWGNWNPTAACVRGELFCSGNGFDQGEGLDHRVPRSFDVASGQTVLYPVVYQSPAIWHPSLGEGGGAGVAVGQSMTAVLEPAAGSAILVVVEPKNLHEWQDNNMSVYTVDILSSNPPLRTVIPDAPEKMQRVVALGNAMVGCGESKVYQLRREALPVCVLEWWGGGCEENSFLSFSALFSELAAPPACELLAVADGAFVLFNAGRLYRGEVAGSEVTWAEAGEYQAPDQEGWAIGLTAWTGQYIMHWTNDFRSVPATAMVGRLFDWERRAWVNMSDPGFFVLDEEAPAVFDDIQGFQGKFYLWTHGDQFGLYRVFGSDRIFSYEPATGRWEELTDVWALPDTLGDTGGGLEQPLLFWVEADGALLMLDKRQSEQTFVTDGVFDIFTVPLAVATPSSGNLWADLSTAFDGDTVCLAPATSLATTVRFGLEGFPARVSIQDCAQPSVRRVGAAAGAAELRVGAGALLVCFETDGCDGVELRSLRVTCQGPAGPAAMQLIGRSATLTLSDVTVQGCAAAGDGGAVLVDNGRLTVTRSLLEGLEAAGSGGAVFVRGGQVEILGSSFVGCRARFGGAIAAAPLLDTVVGAAGAEFVTFNPNITITDSSFVDNAARAGGAVHVSTSTLSVRGSAFEGNNATRETGGALQLVGSQAMLGGNRMQGNEARWGGGAVFWQSEQPETGGEELCGAGGNRAAWGPCVASNAQEIVVAAPAGTVHSGITLQPITAQMRDFYGQRLTTEAEALFEVVASRNFTLEADPDVQVTGTLIQKAEAGQTTFGEIVVQVRFSRWDLAAQQTDLVSAPLLYFASVDPYSGAALRSDILALPLGAGPGVCPPGYVLELEAAVQGRAGSLGRCVLCGPGTYSLSPLSSPTPGATVPDCFPCPVGAGAACVGGDQFQSNLSEAGRWSVEGAAWRLAGCPDGFIVVRDDASPDQDQCVECPSASFSRGQVDYQPGAAKVAARAVEAPGKCDPCPSNAVCDGGPQAVPDKGFWSVDGAFTPPPAHRELTASGLEMYKCPAGACEGGNVCAEGHSDRVCAVCQEGWARTPGGCLQCEGDVGALKAVAGVLGGLAFLVLWYWFAWRPMLEDVSVFQTLEHALQSVLSCWFKAKDAQEEAGGRVGMLATGLGWMGTVYAKVKGDMQGFLKIIISFYQVVSSFASTFTVDWPASLVRLFDGAKFFQLDFISLPGPACLTFDWTYRGRLLVYTLTPLIVVLLISLPVSIAFWAARRVGSTAEYPKWDRTASLFWYSLLFFLYVIYPMVSVQCLSTFSCHDLGPAGNWLVADFRVWCPNDDPADFLFGWSLFFTLVYPAGIPLFFAGVMLYFRIPAMAKQKLDTERLQKTIDLYRRETGSAEGASLVRHMESLAAREGAEGDVMVGMRRVFARIDADGNGALSLEELRAYMVREGLCSEPDFDRALPLQRALRRAAGGKGLGLDAFVGLCEELDRSYSAFTGRDIPPNLAADERAVQRLSRAQLTLLAEHPWDFTEEEGPDASAETMMRNMAEGTDGRRSSEEDEPEEEQDEEEGPPLTLAELEDKVEGIAGELESFGKVVVPALGWDGSLDGEQAALDRIGFLFTMYEVKFWYFELVEMVRKLLITAVLVFVFPRSPAQLAAGLVISFGSLIIYYSCRPFLSERLDALQIFALITQCVNLFYGIMLIVQDATAGTTGSAQEDSLITGIVVLLNCLIVAVPFLNMAAERGLSASSLSAFLPCCRPAPGPARDQEEGGDGPQPSSRFRGSSAPPQGSHDASAEESVTAASIDDAAGTRVKPKAPKRSESQEAMLPDDDDDDDDSDLGERGGAEEGAVELSTRPVEQDAAAAGPTEVAVTLMEPVKPSLVPPSIEDSEVSPYDV